MHCMNKWNRKDKILLLENMEMYVSSGLTVHQALNICISVFRNKQRSSLESVKSVVESGQSLAYGFVRYMKFSTSIIGLIEQGEQSGNIPQSLKLARFILEREDNLIRTCLSALAYPVIIGIFAILLTIGLMRGVMPQIIPLLKSLHVTLPLLTRIVMYLSENIFVYGLCGLVIFIIIIPLLIYLYKKWFRFTSTIHKILLRIPIIGSLFRLYSLSLMIRSLGSLVSSGVNMTTAYAQAVNRITLLPLKSIFSSQKLSLSQGKSLAIIFADMEKVPSHVAPLISAGESSGTLGECLIRSADIIDRDIEQYLKRLTALIEPIMMIFIGLIVGAIALSIIMPIYDVSKNLQH